MSSIEKHALDRWMYRMSGMDYGPFSTKDILDFVTSGQLDEETQLRSHRSRKWERLADVPAFREFVEDLRRKETEKKREKQIEDSVMRVQRTLTKGNRVSWVLLASLVAIGGAIAYYVLLPEEPAGSELSFDVFRDLDLERLPLVKATIASPTPKKAKAASAKRRTWRRKGTGANAVKEAAPVAAVMPPAPEVDLSFDSNEVSGGREITRGDLDSIQKRASPRLIRCFRKEAGSVQGFEGGVVTLYILTSGKVALSRLDTRPGPSRTLMNCTQAAVNGIRVPAFAGANQVMRLPIHVAGVR